MREDVIALFHELADLPPSARAEYYQSRQIADSVREEVESLLEFDQKSESLTEHIGEIAEEIATGGVGEGTVWGPYRVIHQLGRGGMGAVYLAERADGEVEQRVAIKVVLSGAELPAFQRRFLEERQILASLNHSGIARLLDAGRTSEGQPYLVMEYIDGVSIDAYCAQLDLRSILKLVVSVCDAVSYAHRKLIIHRDLKPSNILIDAAGQPKLLDFGIAKILDNRGNARTVVQILTPEYASPEQVSGEANSTATDIYSLGAVLYKLLTGSPPNLSGARTAKSDSAPGGLKAGIPRDVDFIVRKALRKEPEERYATADALADDLRAFLENRPVRARSGDAWYRARKFLRRYWIPVTAAAVALTGLSAGLYIANRERLVAEARFAQVRDLSNQMFKLDGEIRNLPGATKARHALVTLSLQYLERLGQQAHGDQDLALEVGSAYLAVARVQGVPGNSNLGEMPQSDETLRKADAMIDSVLAKSLRNRVALERSAEIAHDRMILASTMRPLDERLAYAQKAAERVDKLASLGNLSKGEAETASQLYGNIALANTNLHQLDDAVRYARRAVKIGRDANTPALAGSLSVLANALRLRGDLEEALRVTRQARAIQENRPDDYSRATNLIIVTWREGRILGEDGEISLNRPAEAVVALQSAYDLAEQLVRRDPADYASRARLVAAGRDLGDILRHNDPERALAVYDAALQRCAEIKNTESLHDRVRLLAGSSYPLRALHRAEESKRRIDMALAQMQELKIWPSQAIHSGDETAHALQALGDFDAATGRLNDAVQTYRELLDKIMASKPTPETDLRDANGISAIEQRLAELERKAGNKQDADALERSRRELWQRWDRRLPNNTFVQRQLASTLPN